MCYISTCICSQICTALNAAFDLESDRKYCQTKEFPTILKIILTNRKIFALIKKKIKEFLYSIRSVHYEKF